MEVIQMQEKPDGGVTNAIPVGLVRCEQCGELKGRGLTPDQGRELVTVSCLCEGLVCGNCGQDRIHRPVSSNYNEEDGKVWHTPYFMALKSCRVCGERDWVGEYDESEAARKREARLAAARSREARARAERATPAEAGGNVLFDGTLPSGITSHAEVHLDGSGDLVVEVQDIGEELERRFGDSDYEWWVTVRAANTPKLLKLLRDRCAEDSTASTASGDASLLALIVRAFGGRGSAPTDLEDFLKENDIPYETSVYI